MKIAITGAAGHVGVNLVKSLSDLGHSINVLIYNSDCIEERPEVKKIKGSLQDSNVLDKLCNNVDVVFHLASLISIGSETYEQVFLTNVEGTKNVFKAAQNAGVKKFIHFSSIHALTHEPFNLPMDETRELAINSKVAYEKTKSIAEDWVLKQKNSDMSVVVLNPTSIIGPMDKKPSLMGEFISMLYNKNIPALIPGGYDWVDVRDIVEASISSIKNGRDGERYILSGGWYSIKAFADMFMGISDKNFKLPVIPLWLGKMGIPFMGIYAKIAHKKPIYTSESLYILQTGNRMISSKKAERELGFKSRPIEETLQDTYVWFKENNYF